MEFDEKKYVSMEKVLQKITKKYISLPENDVKRNNGILLKVVSDIIQKMRDLSPLFDKLYQSNYFGGSYYDNLKIGSPSEYDLDCILVFPKGLVPKIIVSNKPGFVHLCVTNVEKLVKDDVTFKGLSYLITDGYLCTNNVLAWVEGLINKALNKHPKTDKNQAKISYDSSTLLVKLVKSGPALTLKVEGEFGGETYNLDVDLVTCFGFTDEQWPSGGYRKNPSAKKNTFFIVPKSPSNITKAERYWRLSFQEQERELLSGYQVLKPTIKIIKKLRDRYQHPIASYYIKTVFLWELEKQNKDLWSKPISVVLMFMLDKYADYLIDGKISYYWNKKNNLIENLKTETYTGLGNRVKNIVKKVGNEILVDTFIFASLLLSSQEFTDLKEEVSQTYPENSGQNSGIDVTVAPTTSRQLQEISCNLQKFLIVQEINKINSAKVQTKAILTQPEGGCSVVSVAVQTISDESEIEVSGQILANLQRKIDNLTDDISCLRGDNAKIMHYCERLFGKVSLLEDKLISLQKENGFLRRS